MCYYYMAVTACGPNTKILQFDWFASGQIFRIFATLGWDLSENLLRTIRKRKVAMQSEVGEEIPHEMTTELQVFI